MPRMTAVAATPSSPAPRFVEMTRPAPPGSGEVLCRTLELGVCGTDREILQSQQPFTPPRADHLVLGHECLARVEAVGPGVAAFAVGDLVTPLVRRPLPDAPPRRADLLAFGQYEERGIVAAHGFSAPWWLDRAEYLISVPPGIESAAVFTEPMSVSEKGLNEAQALQAARLGNIWEQQPPRVLVTGLGPIAFAALLGCRSRNWPATVCARDGPHSPRVELARQFGAEYLPPDAPEGADFDLILECTGNDAFALAAAARLGPCGVLVWLGAARVPQPRQHDLDRLMRRAVINNHLLLGSVNSAPRDFHDAHRHLARLLADHGEALAGIFTERVRPADCLADFASRRRHGVKVVVMYE